MEDYNRQYFIPEKVHWEKRITPVKCLITKDGSEELLALLVSPVNMWEHENEFIEALNLHEGQNVEPMKGSQKEYLAAKLHWFNSYLPKYITIMPDYRSEKKVLSDVWCCHAVMWKESENYYAYYWQTTA